MDLQAIWTRIDQLEQLIVAQAREIDILRRSLGSAQMTLDRMNSQSRGVEQHHESCPNGPRRRIPPLPEPVGFEVRGQAFSMIRENSRLNLENNINNNNNNIVYNDSHRLDRTNQKHQQQQQLYKSYVMHPIHPANAIPPVARRIVLSSAAEINQSHLDRHEQLLTSPDYLHFGKTNRLQRGGSERPSSQNFNSLGAINSNSSRDRPINARWSTGPSLLAATTDYDASETLGEQGHRKRGLFSLIEIITCFCPCFNLC